MSLVPLFPSKWGKLEQKVSEKFKNLLILCVEIYTQLCFPTKDTL